MYSFEQLRGFVAVAEELHFGRAAERLRMTQPPLSRAIQKLEREVGVILFERGSRAVALTAAGEAFLVDARRLLSATERAGETARRVAAGTAGTLTLGFTAMAAVSILPELLRDFDRHLPDVDLVLEELVSADQFARLANGEIDLGLVRLPPRDGEIEARLVQREHLVAAVPTSHPLAEAKDALSVTELDGVDMIDYSAGASYFADLVAGTLAQVRPRSRQRVTQIPTMLALVGAGRGIAIVPEAAAALQLPGVEIRRLREARTPIVELRAAWHRANPSAALARALSELPTLAHDA